MELAILLAMVVTIASVALGAGFIVRGREPEALGLFAMGGTTGIGAAASLTEFSPWIQGGWGMHPISLAGGVGLGAALVWLLGRKRVAKTSALVGVVVTALLGAIFYLDAIRTLEEVIQFASRDDRQMILEGGRAEARRLLEWSFILLALTGLILGIGSRMGARPASTRAYMDAS